VETPFDVSMLVIENILLVTPQRALHDAQVQTFKDNILNKIRESNAKGMVMDLGNIRIVDSFMGRNIGDIANSAGLLGAEVVIIGLRPDVAITMIELGISWENIHASLNLDDAMRTLREPVAT